VRVVRAIAIGLVVVVATGALTVAGLTWLPGILVASADATPEAQVWPVATVERQVPRPVPPVERITIAAVGDLMAHMPQVTSASVTGGYDFTPCFAFVEPEISSADLAIGNLETTLAGADRGFSGYPTFNTPDEFAQAAAGAGFDVLTTANNHVLDYGSAALADTVALLDAKGIMHAGAGQDRHPRRAWCPSHGQRSYRERGRAHPGGGGPRGHGGGPGVHVRDERVHRAC